jgi:starch-binding outer membrane protein, SusD/RagB family
MKNIKSQLVSVIAALLLLTACVNDLDVTPIDPSVITSANAYKTTDDFKKGLAKLYATYAVSGQRGPSGQPDIAGIDEGFGNYLRQYWNAQELTTDEALIAWNDATIKDFHYQTWSPSDVFIGAVYSRIMYTITLCNEFIRATATSTEAEVKTMQAEARFLRALSYYHALDLFGNPPFVTEADQPGSYFPPQTNRADLFQYIESELLAIESELGAPKFEYGRADKGAMWMLLSKLYLGAEVYIDQAKYTEAVATLKKLLTSNYSLSSNYLHNFVADNHTSPEMIFSIGFDEVNTQSYGGMVYIVHACIGGSMPAADMFGVNGGWGGIRTTSALVEKFEDTSGDTDKRALFWSDGQALEINDVGQFTDGWAVTKFRNRKLDGSQASASPPGDFVNTDYPMFRLGDAYLMFAEAVLRGGTGASRAEALSYVNALRERAYGDNSGNISDGQLTLDFILDERARELFYEGHRRTDLIRFGKFTGGAYLWPWKGGVKDGAPTESFRDLFPIPAADIGANPLLEPNPGYLTD